MTPVSVKLVPPIHTEHMEGRLWCQESQMLQPWRKPRGHRLAMFVGTSTSDVMQSG